MPSEPAHIYRAERCDGAITHIAADYMLTDEEGFTRLFVREEGKVLGTLVALLPPHPGLSIIRVDCLITKEGLNQP